MKRFAMVASGLAVLLMLSSAQAQGYRYGWSISNSLTNPLSNSGNATSGVTTLYLWLECCDPEGMAAAEFDIEASGITILATVPQNGFLNAGGREELLLAAGGCPCGPVVAANLLVMDLPGSLCLRPSLNGNLVTVNCDVDYIAMHESDWIGYSNSGVGPPCSEGNRCRPEFVRDASWSAVKGFYRQ